MSDKSFHEKVQEYRDGEREDNPFEELPQWKIWGFLGGFALILILGWAFLLNDQPFLALIIIGVPIASLLLFTESGQEFLKEISESMENQQQQQQNSSKNKQICSNCGWRNPPSNNYCHDCGTDLSSKTNDNNR